MRGCVALWRWAFLMLDLSPANLLNAYAHGVFPMADSRDGEVSWYTADPRAILPLDAFHVPRGLRRVLRRRPFDIRMDTAFREVMIGCSEPRLADGDTWINLPIIAAYGQLHDLGYAHSVEAWSYDGQLVGGLYGVSIGGAFFGESMFSRVSDASKVCLFHLVEHLRARGYALLDVQFHNPHLQQFGVIEITAAEYLARLREAIALDVTWQ
jgi:leucyl/phenylalanyl-tRNA--protein transferase